MACLCEETIGKGIELSSYCIGSLWVFQNLGPEELAAIAQRAARKAHQRGDSIFIQGNKAVRCFS